MLILLSQFNLNNSFVSICLNGALLRHIVLFTMCTTSLVMCVLRCKYRTRLSGCCVRTTDV